MSAKKAVSGGGRLYGGISHEERVAERYKAFVEAGIEVFGTSGFRAGTVRAICSQAGLTDRYYYESFADSEALLRAVYQHLSDRLHRAISEASARSADNATDKVDATLGAFFGQMKDRRVGRVMLVEITGAGRSTTALFKKNNADFARLIVEMGREWVPGFQPGEGDERILGFALVGAVVLAATYWMLGDYREPMSRVVQNCRNVILGTMTYRQGKSDEALR